MSQLAKKISYWIVALIVFTGCASDFSKRMEPFPSSFGKVNQIIVIADSSLWASAVGDTFRYHFSSPYLVLPQPEPIFDLVHFTAKEIIREPIRKEFRNYVILADVDNSVSGTFNMIKEDIGEEKLRELQSGKGYISLAAKNKWADDQHLVFMLGNGRDKLIENIQKNYDNVVRRFDELENKRIETTVYAVQGINEGLRSELIETFGIDLKIPSEFFKAIENVDDNTIWLRREEPKVSNNILIHRVPYNDPAQLSKENLKKIRDEIGRKYISTTLKDTYMRTNDVDLPMIVEQIDLNGKYALQAHGIWDIVNDYMGGPFVSYLVLDESKGELVFLDGFIHAPGEEKRDFMEEMEVVLRSAKLMN